MSDILFKRGGLTGWVTGLLICVVGCGLEERDLFLVRPSSPKSPDMVGERDLGDFGMPDASKCTPLACQPQDCGPKSDGCGNRVDCGLCPQAPCPAQFEPIASQVANPKHVTYTDQALFYSHKNGSEPIVERRAPEFDQGVSLGPNDVAGGLAVTPKYVFSMGTDSLQRFDRRPDNEANQRYVSLPTQARPQDLHLTARHLWLVQNNEMWRLPPLEETLTRQFSLQASFLPGSLGSDKNALYWVEKNGDASHTLFRASLDQPKGGDVLAQLQMSVTALEGMEVGEGGVLAGVLGGRPGIWKFSPTGETSPVLFWDEKVEVLEIKRIDKARMLVMRTLQGSAEGGWLVSAVDVSSGGEEMILSFGVKDSYYPAVGGISTDGRCAFVAYQYAYTIQLRGKGDVGWIRLPDPSP